jgi:hypothetical protein
MPDKDGSRQVTEKLGPTGEYPFGKEILPGDQGGLNAGMRIIGGKIVILYATPVTWVALTPDEAIRFAEALIAKAKTAKTDG